MTRWAAAVLILVCILVYELATGHGSTISLTPVVQNNAQAKPTKWYVSKSVCSGPCHGLKEPVKDDELLPICRCIEVTIWDEKDKHKLAHTVLRDPRAKKMGELLHYDVVNDPRCVTCHGVVIQASDMKSVDDSFKDPEIQIKEGVTCGVCHGFYEEWINKHGARPKREEWRKLSREDKQTQYGMTDLWDPAKRTQLCASCHVGNVAEGKVVSHEMYAAGHPPLPSFEVVTFSNQLPRHWQLLAVKNKEVVKQMGFLPGEVELEQSNLLAIGTLSVLRESLQLLAAQPAEHWPELANYDCYACHHELKSKSWRQERGYAGKPGRPPMREWPTALATLGLNYAAANAKDNITLQREFQAKLSSLQGAFDALPFGRPPDVRARAADLNKWIDSQIATIHHRIALDRQDGGYKATDSTDLFSHLLSLGRFVNPAAKLDARTQQLVPDYDSARQLALAFLVLYLEVKSKHDPMERDKLASAMATNPAWMALADYLRLTFPVGQVQIDSSIGDELQRIGKYEPREFFQRMDAVLKQFKAP